VAGYDGRLFDIRLLVVPAYAGTHNHRRLLGKKPSATVTKREAAAYGSLLSQGRHRGARNAHAGYDAPSFFPVFSIFAIRRASTFQ
jgi:hypothetical protein